jgi:hypothetical protein
MVPGQRIIVSQVTIASGPAFRGLRKAPASRFHIVAMGCSAPRLLLPRGAGLERQHRESVPRS